MSMKTKRNRAEPRLQSGSDVLPKTNPVYELGRGEHALKQQLKKDQSVDINDKIGGGKYYKYASNQSLNSGQENIIFKGANVLSDNTLNVFFEKLGKLMGLSMPSLNSPLEPKTSFTKNISISSSRKTKMPGDAIAYSNSAKSSSGVNIQSPVPRQGKV